QQASAIDEQSLITASTSTTIPPITIKTENMAAEVATVPNVPELLDPSTQNLSQKIIASNYNKDEISDVSTDSTEIKKKKEYGETVSRSYILLAEQKGWKNPDNSLFPISSTNLCNYIRVKMATNNPKSIEWYINANLANLEFPNTFSSIPFLDDVMSGNKETLSTSTPLDGNDDSSDSPEDESSESKSGGEKFDAMIVGSESEDDDEDYVPPKMRKRYQEVHYIQETMFNDDEEPESFKSRYEIAYASLKSKYSKYCHYHYEGCVLLDGGRHFILSEKLYKRWAALVASGDDFDIDSLPNSPELTEFYADRAIPIPL
ncbi:4556_t:CDS:2, partial [Diversispora eburnea]